MPIVGQETSAVMARARGSITPSITSAKAPAAAMARAATDGPPGIYNVAGDGRLTVTQLAERLGKPVLRIPASALFLALRVGRRLGLTPYGPEQVRFLRYRPVLANDALRTVFGFTPRMTSAEAFEAYLETHPGVARR